MKRALSTALWFASAFMCTTAIAQSSALCTATSITAFDDGYDLPIRVMERAQPSRRDAVRLLENRQPCALRTRPCEVRRTTIRSR